MLRRYLTTSSENSFPAGTFQRAFVFARASSSAASPGNSSRDEGQPVRDKGILITPAPPKETGEEVTVAMSGYVACLGATWLTYIVKHDASGWKVTGAPGPRTVA